MKKWILALVLVLAGAAIAHGVYIRVCPRVAENRCTMQWLKAQLDLSPEQFAKIEAIHKARWPMLKQLQKEQQCAKEDGGGGGGVCERATQELIEAVCAELRPEQRAKYLSLVSPCSKKERGTCPAAKP